MINIGDKIGKLTVLEKRYYDTKWTKNIYVNVNVEI